MSLCCFDVTETVVFYTCSHHDKDYLARRKKELDLWKLEIQRDYAKYNTRVDDIPFAYLTDKQVSICSNGVNKSSFVYLFR